MNVESSFAPPAPSHRRFIVRSANPPALLLSLLRERGWHETHGSDWDLCWGDGAMLDVPSMDGTRKPRYVNRLAGIRLLSNKSSLNENLVAAGRRSGSSGTWDFFPLTFDMPSGFDSFAAYAREHPESIWIAKRAGGARGVGTYLFDSPSRAPRAHGWIVQQYLDEPHLLDGFKYTLRVFVAITSLAPLTAHIYSKGLVKRTAVPYSADRARLADTPIHLTNPDVQRQVTHGHQAVLSFAAYFDRLMMDDGLDPTAVWKGIRRVAAQTVVAARESAILADRQSVSKDVVRFQILGMDILIDRELRPWLLEVNGRPSLDLEWAGADIDRADEDELQAKRGVIEDALALAGPLAVSSLPQRPEDYPLYFERNCGAFDLLIPGRESEALSGDWFPRDADRRLHAAFGLTAPAQPGVGLPPTTVFTSDGAIAFFDRSASFIGLNPAAAEVVSLHEQGLGAAEIAARTAAGAADPESSLARVEGILSDLWALEAERPRLPLATSMSWHDPTPLESGYALGPCLLVLRYARKEFQAIMSPLLGHLEIPGPLATAYAVDVSEEKDAITVRSSTSSAKVPELRMLPAAVISVMLRTAYQTPDVLMAFHAGAVARRGAGVIISGASGQGKTTLTAGLTAAGCALLSDEAAILDGSMRIVPAPVPLGLTEHGMELLDAFVGGLPHLPEYLRRDGSGVHYLRLAEVASHHVPLVAAIVPRVVAGERSRIAPLTPRAGFEALCTGGFDLGSSFPPAEVGQALDRLTHLAMAEVQVGSLEEVVPMVIEWLDRLQA